METIIGYLYIYTERERERQREREREREGEFLQSQKHEAMRGREGDRHADLLVAATEG